MGLNDVFNMSRKQMALAPVRAALAGRLIELNARWQDLSPTVRQQLAHDRADDLLALVVPLVRKMIAEEVARSSVQLHLAHGHSKGVILTAVRQVYDYLVAVIQEQPLKARAALGEQLTTLDATCDPQELPEPTEYFRARGG